MDHADHAAPVAADDTAVALMDSALAINVAVLDNDSDPNNPADSPNSGLTVAAVSTPACGTTTIASGATSVTFMPSAGFYGECSFEYTVRDAGSLSATASVLVHVNAGDYIHAPLRVCRPAYVLLV